VKVSTALLGDAATAREGLLSVLHGGVTRVNAQTYPFQYQGSLGLIFTFHPTEASHPHQFQILLQSEDGRRLLDLTGTLQADPAPDLQPGEEMSVPAALNFVTVLSSPGRYSFEILMDGIHQTSIAFRAMPPPSQEG
jgi:hypothetical protein